MFTPDGARTEVIRGEEQHSGVRVSFACSLARADVLARYAGLAQTRYQFWRRKNRREELPEHFDDLLTEVIAFAEPAVDGGAAQLTWRASCGAWG